jgi:hypothetical protein
LAFIVQGKSGWSTFSRSESNRCAGAWRPAVSFRRPFEEVLAANAEMLGLWRKQQSAQALAWS